MAPRPTECLPLYTDEILARMIDGETLVSICMSPHLPRAGQVRKWVLEDRNGFRNQFAIARDLQADALAERCVENALTAKDAQLGRLQFDAARWFASKMKPKVYGDKMNLVINENKPEE